MESRNSIAKARLQSQRPPKIKQIFKATTELQEISFMVDEVGQAVFGLENSRQADFIEGIKSGCEAGEAAELFIAPIDPYCSEITGREKKTKLLGSVIEVVVGPLQVEKGNRLLVFFLIQNA